MSFFTEYKPGLFQIQDKSIQIMDTGNSSMYFNTEYNYIKKLEYIYKKGFAY